LLQAAHDAWLKFENFTEEQVERILLEISKVGIPNAEPLAKLAVESYGRAHDAENLFAPRMCI